MDKYRASGQAALSGFSKITEATRCQEFSDARISDTVFRRARHIVTDNARTLAAADALRGGNLKAMGELMHASHDSQREDFEITVPDTNRLTMLMQIAIGKEGGARQTGGGFGGAVVGLMRQDAVARVTEHVLRNYRTPSGGRPDIRVERASAGASIIQSK